jgi:hypothetical protein
MANTNEAIQARWRMRRSCATVATASRVLRLTMTRRHIGQVGGTPVAQASLANAPDAPIRAARRGARARCSGGKARRGGARAAKCLRVAAPGAAGEVSLARCASRITDIHGLVANALHAVARAALAGQRALGSRHRASVPGIAHASVLSGANMAAAVVVTGALFVRAMTSAWSRIDRRAWSDSVCWSRDSVCWGRDDVDCVDSNTDRSTGTRVVDGRLWPSSIAVLGAIGFGHASAASDEQDHDHKRPRLHPLRTSKRRILSSVALANRRRRPRHATGQCSSMELSPFLPDLHPASISSFAEQKSRTRT